MKKFIIIKLIFISGLFAEDTIQVCNSLCDFSHIQEAIDFSSPGSTIYVYPGIYKLTREIIISKPIRLIAQKDNLSKEVIIDGNHKTNVILITETEDVEISGFTIINSGYSDIKEYAGIYIQKSKNCKIHNNKILNNTFGIYLERSQNCLIEENQIISKATSEVQSGNGIHLWYSYDNILQKNLVSGHRDGFYFEYSENLIVRNNISLYNLRYGIHFMFCHNSKIRNNRFIWNPTGVALMYSKKLDLSYNQFTHSWGKSFKALLLKEIDNSIISHNVFYNNTTGIYTDNSNRNRIFQNQFVNNGISLEILGNSYYNQIKHNVFENNIFDVATNSRDNPNIYINNYWDKYKGYDLNKDGYGDVPYKPVSLFSYWVSRYPTLAILVRSPMVDFLELLEKVFPIITPAKLLDEKPLMYKLYIAINEKERKTYDQN